MTWAQPVALSAFDPNSPFAGLPIPDDVRVTRQVLAEPSLDLSSRTWARLSDGTPLVTADKRDEGWLVLVHTTANPEWSSLPLSGLFVEMMQRLVGLSQGVAGTGADIALPPVSALDGFGRLQAPPPAAGAIAPGGFTKALASPKSPPGYYGTETSRRALNLAAAMPPPKRSRTCRPALRALSTPVRASRFPSVAADPGACTGAGRPVREPGTARRLVRTRAPHRGRAARRRRDAGGTRLRAVQSPAPGLSPTNDDNIALLATLTTRFAYVGTGIAEIDDIARAGMTGLGAILTRRTAVDPGPPVEVDPEDDELAFYPLIYWPIAPQGQRISYTAIQRINADLKNGGTIVFEARGGGQPERPRGAAAPRHPAPAQPLAAVADFRRPRADQGVLSAERLPPTWTGAPVWVELGDDRVNDGVSSVVIGGNDWAAAWALDQNGRPMFAAVPGSEAQRETRTASASTS